MLYISLIFVILGYIGTVVIGWQSIQKKSKLTTMALVFIVFGGFGAAWVVVDSSRASNELIKKSDEIARLNQQLKERSDRVAGLYKTIAESQEALKEKSNKIADLSHALALKSDEIASLNHRIAASVLGGDSFCYFEVVGPNWDNTFDLKLHHRGEYPVYDVLVRMTDQHEVIGKMMDLGSTGTPQLGLRAHQKALTTINIGTVSPQNKLNYYGPFTIPSNYKDSCSYRIDISARNGMVHQDIHFRKVGQELRQAVRTRKGNRIIDQKVDLDFPRNARGDLDLK